MCNGAKLGFAPVARAPPLFPPRPKIVYINVLHFVCPTPNLFSKCTTTFKPQLAPLSMCQLVSLGVANNAKNSSLFDLVFTLLKILC